MKNFIIVKWLNKIHMSGYIPSNLLVNGLSIGSLNALGGFHRAATTKAGRLSLTGRLSSGEKVKIYSVLNSGQATLRVVLQELQPIDGLHWPAILANDEGLVVEEWIDGQPLPQLSDSDIKRHMGTVRAFLQACQTNTALHKLAAQHSSSFCYIHNYLLPRLQPWAHWQPVAQLLQRWQLASDAVAHKLPRRLSHPDLSLANLVVQRQTGKLYVIDNELLGVGQGWVLDGNNSFLKKHPMADQFDADVERFAKVGWCMRLVGSALDAGRFKQAAELALGSGHD